MARVIGWIRERLTGAHGIDEETQERDEWVNSIQMKLNANILLNEDIEGSCIPRVPKGFCRDTGEAYEPCIISIGPYHRGKPKLEHMEWRKWQCLRRILGPEGGINILNEFFQGHRHLEARMFYSDDFHLERMDFMEMMLLDGCFIVDYLCQFFQNMPPLQHIPEARRWMQRQINNDLLLLENQLPFSVLEDIYGLVNNNQGNLQEVARTFCQHVTKRTPPPVQGTIVFQHLLHFFHAFLFSGQRQRGNQLEIQTIHTASVLKKAGIRFERDAINRVINARFTDGVMRITPLVINSFTISQYENLIAFEKVNPTIEPQFTAFAQFMTYIIDTSEDVKLLREEEIIQHALGSDKEVAIVFNQLTTGTLEYITPELAILYRDAVGYCNNPINKYRASLMRKYLTSPWVIFPIASLFILVSAAIYQAVFTALNYFQRKHSRH